MSVKSSCCLAAMGCLLFISMSGCVGNPPEDLDGFVLFHMEQSHIPGLSAARFSGNEVLWAKGYGWADIEAARPVGAETLFQLASISKLVTATAVMQLVETGRMDLDADINAYLPFNIENPYHADVAITGRMLLTHTSSLLDNVKDYEALYTWGGDSPMPLREFLEGFYTPGGRWYKAPRCFLKGTPGTEWSYSNSGFALLGYLVEVITGEAFDGYCRNHIFMPLGMAETAWFLRDLVAEHIAMPYRDASFLGCVRYRPYGQYGYPDYPSGQLRTSVLEFARFFQMFMNDGVLDGTRLLQAETVGAMLSVQFPDLARHQGLGWILLEQEDGSVLLGHGGGEHGVLTMAWYDRDTRAGVLVFTSGDPNDLLIWRTQQRVDAISAIQSRLFQEAGS